MNSCFISGVEKKYRIIGNTKTKPIYKRNPLRYCNIGNLLKTHVDKNVINNNDNNTIQSALLLINHNPNNINTKSIKANISGETESYIPGINSWPINGITAVIQNTPKNILDTIFALSTTKFIAYSIPRYQLLFHLLYA